MMKIKQDVAQMGAQKRICLLFTLVSLRSAAVLRLFPLTVSQQSLRIFRNPKMFLLIGNNAQMLVNSALKMIIIAGNAGTDTVGNDAPSAPSQEGGGGKLCVTLKGRQHRSGVALFCSAEHGCHSRVRV